MGVHIDHACENGGEDDHCQQRLDNGPANACKTLLVPYLYVALGKNQNDVPVAPDLQEFQFRYARRRVDVYRLAPVSEGCQYSADHHSDLLTVIARNYG